MAGFNAHVGEPVWEVTLCHGDWFEGPRVAVITVNEAVRRTRAVSTRDPGTSLDPFTDGALSAALVVANGAHGNATAIVADAAENIALLVGRAQRHDISVAGTSRSFRAVDFYGETIAVSRMAGDLVVAFAARDVPLADIELCVTRPDDYGLSPHVMIPT